MDVHPGPLDQPAVAAAPQRVRLDLALHNNACAIAAAAAAEESRAEYVVEGDVGGGADDEELLGFEYLVAKGVYGVLVVLLC